MKLCKDCKHCQPHPLTPQVPDNSQCAKSRAEVSFVTGDPDLRFAVSERKSTDPAACGPEATLFEPKADPECALEHEGGRDVLARVGGL